MSPKRDPFWAPKRTPFRVPGFIIYSVIPSGNVISGDPEMVTFRGHFLGQKWHRFWIMCNKNKIIC